MQKLALNKQKLSLGRFCQISTQNKKYEFFKVTWKNFRKKMCFDFFESRLKRKLRKHWRESWLTSTRYFEVLVVKLTQTLFLNIILRKILRKKSKKRKIFEKIFVVIWVVLCVQNINNWFGAFLWHITAENVGTGIPLRG